MFCTSCGKENKAEDNFCVGCGNSLVKDLNESASAQNAQLDEKSFEDALKSFAKQTLPQRHIKCGYVGPMGIASEKQTPFFWALVVMNLVFLFLGLFVSSGFLWGVLGFPILFFLRKSSSFYFRQQLYCPKCKTTQLYADGGIENA